MKKLLFIAVLTAVSFAGFAQDSETKKVKFSIGVEAVAPFGDYADFYSFAIGGSVQADYNLFENFDLTLNAGYLHFLGKSGADGVGLIPVLAGGKYSFTPQLYASAQLGVSFSTESGGGSNFTYAPGIGYKFSEHVDVLAKYVGISTKGGGSGINTAGIRLAYTF
jgi:hypothetical protein